MSTAIAVMLVVLADTAPSRAFSRAPLGNEPLRPYVDLGPVAVPRNTSEAKLRKHLQLIADRIGADGFIIESRDPFGIYGQYVYADPITPVTSGISQDQSGGLAVLFAAIALGNMLLHKPGPDEQVFIRAYTYADLPTASREKLLRISAELFRGKLTLAAFEDARREILEAN